MNILKLLRIPSLSIYKNFGNVGFYLFVAWNVETAIKHEYSFLMFCKNFIQNFYVWFLPSILIFFVFRQWREKAKLLK